MSSFPVASCNRLSSKGFMKWWLNLNSSSYPHGNWNNRMCIKPGRPNSYSVEVNSSLIKRGKSSILQNVAVRKISNIQSSDVDKTTDVSQRIRDAILRNNGTIVASSPYDTAWVAMIPSPESPENPCFPQCLEWILENQKSDGSWDSSSGLEDASVVVKEALSSTLACVIALKRWNVDAHKHIEKGLRFLVSNIKSATDEKEYPPLGFNVVFPSMLVTAKELGLKLHVKQEDLDVLFRLRDSELKRGSEINRNGWKAYTSCIAEGILGDGDPETTEWKEVILKHQLQNGSLFNSPSATAAALLHHPNANGLQYLQSALHNFGNNSVPTAYPFEVSTKLSIIDSAQKLGIDRYFEDIIDDFLNEIHRLWMENDEEIYSDITTCALAFRLLRMHGHNVSSAVFEELAEDIFYCNSTTDGNLNNTKSILELYNASHLKLSKDDVVLEKLNFWTRKLLEERLTSLCQLRNETERIFFEEVDHALKFPSYTNLERNEHKRNIENFAVQNIIGMKKSLLLSSTITHDMFRLAFEDFNTCQSVYQKELAVFESWFNERRLHEIKFLSERVRLCYWSTATTNFPPEMSDARIYAAKNSMLVTAIDVLFDVTGSKEELENFMNLVDRWAEDDVKDHCISEQVHIIFSALYDATKEIGGKASALHNHDVTSLFIEIWVDMINAMMSEAKWRMDMLVPTLDEYLHNGGPSFGLGPIITPSMYFLGPKLPSQMIRTQEFHDLTRLLGTCGRLLNDLNTVEKEAEEGKLNSVSLQVLLANGKMSTEDAKCEIQKVIESHRAELLRLVVRSDDSSTIPRTCKDLFWMMARINHLVYARSDGYSFPAEMSSFIQAVLFDPLNLKFPIHK